MPSWVAAGALLACVGCSSPSSETPTAPSPRPAFAADPLARARLDGVKAAMGRLQACSAACLGTLEELHTRYSADHDVVGLLRAVYLQRSDWDALIRLEEDTPEGQRFAEDRTRLALWCFRKGRYSDASELLERLVAERPEDAAVVRLAGLTLFQIGEHERAIPRLEAALGRLTGADAAEVATALGLIHFRRRELPQAEQALQRALRLAPEYAPACSALGRVLAARGDIQGARAQIDRAAVLRARITDRERRAMRLSAQSQMASQAFEERRWDDCERIVQDMLPEADPALRVRLYRYLGEIRTAAGRGAAAQEALQKAEELALEGARP